MGAPMARSLARGRHDVAVYDASPRALDPFRDGACRVATSARDAAEAADIGITIRPYPAHGPKDLIGY